MTTEEKRQELADAIRDNPEYSSEDKARLLEIVKQVVIKKEE